MKWRANKLKRVRNHRIKNMEKQKRLDLQVMESRNNRKSFLRVSAMIITGMILILIWITIYNLTR